MTITCSYANAFFVYNRNAFSFVTNATQNLTLLLLLLWTTLAKETSIERRSRLSKMDGVKGKKENQRLENLHAKQLLHQLSLHLLLMILTLLFLFPLIPRWHLTMVPRSVSVPKALCILLIQVGCNDILLEKWILIPHVFLVVP